jgi:hypothetical protein
MIFDASGRGATSGDVMVVARCLSAPLADGIVTAEAVVSITGSFVGSDSESARICWVFAAGSFMGSDSLSARICWVFATELAALVSMLMCARLAIVAAAASVSFGTEGSESSVTSSGPSSNSPVSAAGGAAGGTGLAAAEAVATGAATDVAAGTDGVSAFCTGTGSVRAAARIPVSPASRRANVSSSSTGTSIVCGTRRGAEMRSMATMM